jgi:hypothetical protein
MLNRYLLSIGPVDSVPVKPTGQLGRILPTTPHSQPRQPKPRNAYALIASAAACGITIEGGARIPRCFTYQGVDAIIENGVARAILKAGLASLQAASDKKTRYSCLMTNRPAQSSDCSDAVLWMLVVLCSVPDVSAMRNQSGQNNEDWHIPYGSLNVANGTPAKTDSNAGFDPHAADDHRHSGNAVRYFWNGEAIH